MQGLYLNHRRPKTKKSVKEADIKDLALEATSMFGNEYDGPLVEAPAGDYYVVGPDPYTSRVWYATIKVSPTGKVTIT